MSTNYKVNYNSCLIEISPSEPPGAEDDLQFRPLGNKHLFRSIGLTILVINIG